MHIQFNDPRSRGVTITYDDILRTFKKTCESHKQTEVELKKQIDILVGEYKRMLYMRTSIYFCLSDNIFLGEGETFERKPRVSVALKCINTNPISQAEINTSPTLNIPFILTTVVGGDEQGSPFVAIDLPLAIGKHNDVFVVWVGDKRFTVPATSHIPQFDEVCDYVKARVNQLCQG